MKYFSMNFIKQSSKHPDGSGEVEILSEGKTKKEAVLAAKEALVEFDEHHACYRVPVATEITEEEYNADDEEEEAGEVEKDTAENETFYDEFKDEPETPEDKATRVAAEKAESDRKSEVLGEPELEYILFIPNPDLPILVEISSVVEDHKFKHNYSVKIVADGNGYFESCPNVGHGNFSSFQGCVDNALGTVDNMLQQIKGAHSILAESIDLALAFMGDSSEGFIGRHRRPADFANNYIAKYEKCVIELSSGEVVKGEAVDQDESFDMDDDFADFGEDDGFEDFAAEPEGDTHLQVDPEDAIADDVKTELIELTVEDVNAKIAALKPDESFTLYGLPNDVYHACDGYSKSKLDIIAKDAGLLEWAKNAPEDEDKKGELNMGSAVHHKTLEPDIYDLEYAIKKKVNGANKEGKAYNAQFIEDREADGLQVLTEEEDKKIGLMAGSLRAHPKAKQLLSTGAAEVSLFWRDPKTGIVFKIRMDWLTNIGVTPIIFDVKTIDKPEQFEKSVEEFNYHVQDGFYSWVFHGAMKVSPVFAFGIIGKHINLGRYPVRLTILDDSDKVEGLERAMKAIETLQECIKTDRWGGFQIVTRPQWAKKNDLTK